MGKDVIPDVFDPSGTAHDRYKTENLKADSLVGVLNKLERVKIIREENTDLV